MTYYLIIEHEIEDLGERKEVKDGNYGNSLSGSPDSLFIDLEKAEHHLLTKKIDGFLKYSIEEVGVEIDGIYDPPFFDIPMFIDLVEKNYPTSIDFRDKSKQFSRDFVFWVEKAFRNMNRQEREIIINHLNYDFYSIKEMEISN